MIPTKENLKGVEVIVKYATWPKDLLGIVYGKTDYYIFLCVALSFI